jgi:hypothetical protein
MVLLTLICLTKVKDDLVIFKVILLKALKKNIYFSAKRCKGSFCYFIGPS